MFKLRIHPAFLIYSVILIIQNNYLFWLASIVAVALHEWSHAKTAYKLGYILDTLTLMPYGAMLKGEDIFDEHEGIKISFAGPISNFLLCIVLMALWWTFPASYNYTKIFFDASLTIGAFNLLPIFPLDGSRIILSITKNKQKCLKTLRVMGVVLSTLLGILFLLSFFDKPNLSLGIISAIIYISSIEENKIQTYRLITDNCPYVKRLDSPIKKRTLIVHQNLKLIRLLNHVKPDSHTSFEIIDDRLKTIKIMDENQVRELCSKQNLHLPIKELLRP